MRVHFLPPIVRSIALEPVEHSLTKCAPPDISIVKDALDADLIVVPIIGRRDKIRQLTSVFRQRKQRYVIAQYVLRSSQKPNTNEWIDIWQQAHFVWSYYNLPLLCAEDRCPYDFRFYRSPLGGDDDVFQTVPLSHDRPALILSSGRAWTDESARECVLAAQQVGKIAWHLGASFPPLMRSDIPTLRVWPKVSDDELVRIYQQVQYVSGLRRVEGFELPSVEGLLCGARPIMFDRPHYRDWFGPLAEYIPEGTREQELADLVRLFESPYRPVTIGEVNQARLLFDWGPIAEGFWSRCLHD